MSEQMFEMDFHSDEMARDARALLNLEYVTLWNGARVRLPDIYNLLGVGAEWVDRPNRRIRIFQIDKEIAIKLLTKLSTPR